MVCKLEISALAVWLLACSCGGSEAEEETQPADAGVPAVILDGGGGIEPSPNGASLCPPGDCNYQTQEGCDDGMSCRPAVLGQGADAHLEPACQGAGKGAPGSPCTSWLDCAADSLCAGGSCRELCCGGDWESCGEGNSCIRQLLVPVGSEDVDAGVELCFPVNDCILGDPASCDSRPGTECLIVDPTGSVACVPPGDTSIGDACSPVEPCSADQVCVGERCRKLCRAVLLEPDAPRPCLEAESCIHFDRNPEGWGECTPYTAR